MIYKTRNRSADTTGSRKEKEKKTCFNPGDTRRRFNVYRTSCGNTDFQYSQSKITDNKGTYSWNKM